MNATTDSAGFTAEERAAMKQRAAELRAEEKRAKLADKAAADLQDVLDAIAALDGDDRDLAARVHAIVTDTDARLAPRTWYGMPAYALDGQVVVFFKPASKFKVRYAELGFNEPAELDDGAMWPTAFAVVSVGAAEEARIRDLVTKAVGG